MKIPHKLCFTLIIVMIMMLWITSIVVAKTELITNGTFGSNTSGWSNSTSGSVSWSSGQGHAATGAAYVQNTRSSGTYSAGGVQCIDMPTPIADYYTVEGWVTVPSQSNNTTAQGYIRFQFYSNTGCTSALGTARDTPLVDVGSDWTEVNKTGSTSTGAQSVEVRLYVKKTGADSAYAYFDDISFFPSNATAVILSSFDVRSRQYADCLDCVLVALFRGPVVALLGLGLSVLGASLAVLIRNRAS